MGKPLDDNVNIWQSNTSGSQYTEECVLFFRNNIFGWIPSLFPNPEKQNVALKGMEILLDYYTSIS